MAEYVRGFGEVLDTRIRRRGFLYLAMCIFYCMDIYLTLLAWGKGPVGESNPVSKLFLENSGAEGWIMFRVVVLAMTTIALFTTFMLAGISLKEEERSKDIDLIEEIVLGSVMLFYAIALVHNLVSLAAPLQHLT